MAAVSPPPAAGGSVSGTKGQGQGEEEESRPAQVFLQDVLELEAIDEGLYRGFTPTYPGFLRIYGGQTIAQALCAAGKTVSDNMSVHSLHAYFLRPGELQLPILYQVRAIRDGKSFCTRLVQATQRAQVIFSLLASFHVLEPGHSHQLDKPEGIPAPELLPSQEEVWKGVISLHSQEVVKKKKEKRERREKKEKEEKQKKEMKEMKEKEVKKKEKKEKKKVEDVNAGKNFLSFRSDGSFGIKNVDSGTTTVFPQTWTQFQKEEEEKKKKEEEEKEKEKMKEKDEKVENQGKEKEKEKKEKEKEEKEKEEEEEEKEKEEEKKRLLRALEIAQKLPRLPGPAIQYLSMRLQSPLPMETRPVDCSYFDYLLRRIPIRQPQMRVWIRAKGKLSDNQHIHNCAAGYMSDSGFMGTAFLPHALTWSKISVAASLDHSMWFHRPFRADQWLLYVTESWHAGNALGLSFGRIYDRDGNLVITCAQQGLMRPKSHL